MKLVNTRKVSYNFNLSQEFKGIGRTLSIVAKSTTDLLPDNIREESEIKAAIEKGLLRVVEVKDKEEVVYHSETTKTEGIDQPPEKEYKKGKKGGKSKFFGSEED